MIFSLQQQTQPPLIIIYTVFHNIAEAYTHACMYLHVDLHCALCMYSSKYIFLLKTLEADDTEV